MRYVLYLIFQFAAFCSFCQLDSDFLEAKRKADRCFNGKNFDCAILHYTTAIAIKENDDYCKKQIIEAKQRIAYKKNQEALERKREQDRRNQIIKITQEEEKANRPYYGKLNGLKDTYGNEFNYTGNIVNKVPNGVGKAAFPEGAIYEGEFKDGKITGYGKFKYLNGYSYEGYFVNESFEGKGKYLFADGEYEEGEYKNGSLNGIGKYFYKSGDRYEGNWIDNNRSGYSKYFRANGDRIEGEFKNDSLNGEVKIFYPSGDVYQGEFKRKNRNGSGKIFDSTGKLTAEGYFDDGSMIKGTIYGEDKYVGDLKAGVFEGKGIYYFKNGNRYEGEFKYGTYNGFGKEFLMNGDRYEGDFVDGFRTKGKYFLANGKLIYEGNFKNGVPTEKYPNRK